MTFDRNIKLILNVNVSFFSSHFHYTGAPDNSVVLYCLSLYIVSVTEDLQDESPEMQSQRLSLTKNVIVL